MKTKKRGFTLIELLVVVIIIAVLAAVAMPMYKHAVLKSRFSTVMPVAKTLADAQEVYFLGNGQYALSKNELDVTPATTGNTQIALSTAAEEDKYAYVAAQHSDVLGARYIVYQKHSPMFANTIQCEADENNEDALWLCEKGLGGTEIPGSVNTAAGEYKTFLLAGAVGSTDKLPTSIYKLKAQLCAGISENNCTVDEENQTITTQECGTNISYNDGTGTKTGPGCAKTIYDANGEIQGKRNTVCRRSYDSTTGTCTIMNAALSSSPYETTYDEEGRIREYKLCYLTSASECSYLQNLTYDEYGQYSGSKIRSCSGSVDPVTFACSSGTFQYGRDIQYNEKGQITEHFVCGAADPVTGNCTQYVTAAQDPRLGSNISSYRMIYDENGTHYQTCTQWTGTKCTGTWTE